MRPWVPITRFPFNNVNLSAIQNTFEWFTSEHLESNSVSRLGKASFRKEAGKGNTLDSHGGLSWDYRLRRVGAKNVTKQLIRRKYYANDLASCCRLSWFSTSVSRENRQRGSVSCPRFRNRFPRSSTASLPAMPAQIIPSWYPTRGRYSKLVCRFDTVASTASSTRDVDCNVNCRGSRHWEMSVTRRGDTRARLGGGKLIRRMWRHDRHRLRFLREPAARGFFPSVSQVRRRIDACAERLFLFFIDLINFLFVYWDCDKSAT